MSAPRQSPSALVLGVLIAATILPLALHEYFQDWLIRARWHIDLTLLAPLVGGSLLGVFLVWRSWKVTGGNFRFFSVAALVGCSLTLFRTWRSHSPEHQAAYLTKKYIETTKKNFEGYYLCEACSYDVGFDLLDQRLFEHFAADTGLLHSLTQALCDLKAPKWTSIGLGNSDVQRDFSQSVAALYALWRQAGKSAPEQWLQHTGGDRLLLALAFVETCPDARYWAESLQQSYSYLPVHSEGIQFLLNNQARPPYFNQGWLDEKSLRLLYKHYIENIEQAAKEELQILVYLSARLPNRFLTEADRSRLLKAWKSHLPEEYAGDFELLDNLRAHLQTAFAPYAGQNGRLPVYDLDNVHQYWKALLLCSGLEPYEDSNGIALQCETIYRGQSDYSDQERQAYRKKAPGKPLQEAKPTDGISADADWSKELEEIKEALKKQLETLKPAFASSADKEEMRTDLYFSYKLPKQNSFIFALEMPEQLYMPFYDIGIREYAVEHGPYLIMEPSFLYGVSLQLWKSGD